MPISTEDNTSNQRSSPWRSHGRLKLFSDPHFFRRELEFAEIKCFLLGSLTHFLGPWTDETHLTTRSKTMNTAKTRKNEQGSNSAGQSGDIQEMPNAAGADSQSVEELAEEGNAFEADAVEGVEGAKDPDVAEVTTRQVPEDDVPAEYLKDDENVA